MPAIGSSVLPRDYVVCRVTTPFAIFRGRRLARTGQFKGLVPLRPADALELVRQGLVKLPRGISPHMLEPAG